ncbi:uroporphyrinogen decarboxylase [Besnoitia besnoiti]|uniref:Uroporphyrinogen decarboxylase n=1 Tax=Besnoitia besnoiti TaxID=94643 RepID=A0A2A9M4C6_BESBE|nr:uroporphyrinogen decarboxylase [Besnoitia besnoiti]PFH32074.1 uroporphyrinogen decarboxylase [Besnoitia besnoiti]
MPSLLQARATVPPCLPSLQRNPTQKRPLASSSPQPSRHASSRIASSLPPSSSQVARTGLSGRVRSSVCSFLLLAALCVLCASWTSPFPVFSPAEVCTRSASSWLRAGVCAAQAYSSDDRTGRSRRGSAASLSAFEAPEAPEELRSPQRRVKRGSADSAREESVEESEAGDRADTPASTKHWTEDEQATLLASSLGFLSGGLRSFFFPKGSAQKMSDQREDSDGGSPPVVYTLTPEDERAAIRARRQAYKANPREPCVNDTLRRAALGAARYARLVGVDGDRAADSTQGIQQPFLTPVWMMRQAGRYLPEFRNLRRQHGFLEVCRDPLLASELTLQPYRRFPQLDAVIIFSDILVIPEAMGMKLSMEEGVGPRFAWRVESPADVKKLNMKPDIEKTLGYVFDAVYVTSQQLAGAIPLLGFCGGPLTLLTYMIEGGGSKTWRQAKKFVYEEPEATASLLQVISDICVEYLVGQAEAGAQVLQVFDTNASQFAAAKYAEVGAPYLAYIAEKVKERLPHVTMIAFPKDRPSEVFAQSAFDVISLGSSAEIELMQRRFSAQQPNVCGAEPSERRAASDADSKALQGNLDPQILYTDIATIKQETAKMIKKFGVGRHIANLGHGMEPEMDPEHARAFIEGVKEASAAYLLEDDQTKEA